MEIGIGMRNSMEQQRNIAHIDRLNREAACRYRRQRHRAEKNSSGIGFQPPALHRAGMTAHTDGRFAGKCFQIIKSQIKARKRRQKSQPRSRTPCLT